MIRYTSTILALIFAVSLTFAGKSEPEKAGIITPKILAEIQNSFQWDAHTRASYNALMENNLSDLARNYETFRSINNIYSLELETGKITDQASSGRCWLFATFNVLRQKVMQKFNLSDFEFSETYAMFWDKFEKANLFLEYVIMNPDLDYNDREFVLLLKTPLPDGGFWHMSADVIKKYGAVPKEIMPESNSSSRTGKMNNLMTQKMRWFAYELKEMAKAGKSKKALRKAKIDMLKDVYRMLVLNLGMPPKSFNWRYTDKDGNISEIKEYTPLSFYQEAVGVDLDDYVVIGNCPSQPYNKNYRIKLGRGQLEGMDWTFLNLEMKDLKSLALKVLQDSVLCQFSADVSRRQRDNETGYMAINLFDYESVYGVDFKFDKSVWILTRESAPNHAMVLCGADIIDGKVTKWKVENSWGTDNGDGGYYLMTDEWFDRWGYSVVVQKQYLPDNILKLLDTEPVVLPFWDPLARIVSVGGYGE